MKGNWMRGREETEVRTKACLIHDVENKKVLVEPSNDHAETDRRQGRGNTQRGRVGERENGHRVAFSKSGDSITYWRTLPTILVTTILSYNSITY